MRVRREECGHHKAQVDSPSRNGFATLLCIPTLHKPHIVGCHHAYTYTLDAEETARFVMYANEVEEIIIITTEECVCVCSNVGFVRVSSRMLKQTLTLA